MIYVSLTPNSIYIPTIGTGCKHLEFDSAYPVHLNGIISQDEFRESIHRINRVVSTNGSSKVFISFLTIIIVGLIFIVVDKATAVNSTTSKSPSLFCIGMGILCIGSLIMMIVYENMSSRSVARTRQAINIESTKYISRLPTPCSWRLHTLRQCVERGDSQLMYYLVVDIGRSNVQESGSHFYYHGPSQSIVLFGRKGDSAPPSYSDQPIELCSQCGASRQDVTVKFCSSCGHSFNEY